MKFHPVIQGSDDWHALRRGVPTSSEFKLIMTPKSRQLSKSVDRYIDRLIGERMSIYGPERPESYLSNPMRHGVETEEEARRFLCMEKGIDISNGGFCMSDCGRFGASPDGLIDPDGVAEIKCPGYEAQVRYLRTGGVPTEYQCQCHGQLIVTGRKYVLFISYHPGISPHIVRVEPDEFTDALRVALEIFHGRYTRNLAKVMAMQ